MEAILVAFIIGLAAFFVIRKFYRMFKTPSASPCGCGCTSCPIQEEACREMDVNERTPDPPRH